MLIILSRKKVFFEQFEVRSISFDVPNWNFQRSKKKFI